MLLNRGCQSVDLSRHIGQSIYKLILPLSVDPIINNWIYYYYYYEGNNKLLFFFKDLYYSSKINIFLRTWITLDVDHPGFKFSNITHLFEKVGEHRH